VAVWWTAGSLDVAKPADKVPVGMWGIGGYEALCIDNDRYGVLIGHGELENKAAECCIEFGSY